MADITMCDGVKETGEECPWRTDCHRFLAVACPYRQTRFVTPPFDADGNCKYFWRESR